MTESCRVMWSHLRPCLKAVLVFFRRLCWRKAQCFWGCIQSEQGANMWDGRLSYTSWSVGVAGWKQCSYGRGSALASHVVTMLLVLLSTSKRVSPLSTCWLRVTPLPRRHKAPSQPSSWLKTWRLSAPLVTIEGGEYLECKWSICMFHHEFSNHFLNLKIVI